MDGFRTQSFSDTTKSSSIMNQSRTLSSAVIATSSSSSVLHANAYHTSQDPILPISHATKFHPSIRPPADSASLLGYCSSSSRFPVPVTPSTSVSCHSFPSSSKEEPSCSSINSSSASDSDYDSAPLTANVSLPRRSAEMNTQRYDETDVAMSNDETMTRTEDENRKMIRRERNKQAAAKCRQRRVDLTNDLVAETETLDMVRGDLQREVENLVRQKNQLEFIIQAHMTQCRMVTPSSSSLGSIPQFIKLESSDTSSLLRPPSVSSQASASTFSTHADLRPRCQLQQAGNPIFNSSMAAKGYVNQMTSMTSANHMSSTTSSSQVSSSNMTSSMTRATVTMTLPTTSSDAELLMSPTTLDAFGSFDFYALLDEQVGSTPVTDAQSSSSTSVAHNRGDGILPITLLDL